MRRLQISSPLVVVASQTFYPGEEAAAAEGDGSEADLLRRVQYFNLPEHSFKKGDPLLILKADKNGNLPPKVSSTGASPSCTPFSQKRWFAGVHVPFFCNGFPSPPYHPAAKALQPVNG